MNDNVRVVIADDTDYEDLIAEIQIGGDCVAVLTQEDGEVKVEMDRSWIWSENRKAILLSQFKKALADAEASLSRMKKR